MARQDGPVLVIGAGHNGLVCAIALARAGLEVTVLEHAAEPGGGLQSLETTLPGFVHDSCAAFLPVTMVSPAMRELELEREGVEWVNPPVAMAHPFLDGTAIGLHRDLEATVADLEATAPSAGSGWRELAGRTLPLQTPLAESVFARLPPVRPGLKVLAGLRRDAIELARMGVGSVEAFGLNTMQSERATAWLAGSAMHSGLEPRASASGAFGFLLTLLGHRVGWPFPRGGVGTLRDALLAMLTRAGGSVRTNAPVTRILVRGNRAAGVELEGGEQIQARDVVSTISARPLARILPGDALPGRLMRRLERWRYSPGVFKLDYALSGPVPWAAERAREAGVVHVAGELKDLTAAAQASNRGDTPERPALVVGQQSLYDPTRAPEGRHTLYVYTHVPRERDVPDAEVAERMERQIERFAPGFGELVEARHERSPEQLAEGNPSMVGGDLAGGSFELDQQVIFRPAPELARYRTPLRGLYIAGSSVHPGGAIHGVSGREAARSVIEDRSGLRFWR